MLDGGACTVGIESTIVAIVAGEPMLLRPGGVPLADLTRVLGRPPAIRRRRRSACIGYAARPLRAAHTLGTARAGRRCAPRSSSSRTATRTSRCSRARSSRPSDFDDVWLRAPLGSVAYAHDLYANLRTLDAANADVILIEAVPDDDEWLAVRDRLARATRGEDDDRD